MQDGNIPKLPTEYPLKEALLIYIKRLRFLFIIIGLMLPSLEPWE